jgi:hypothetical protein
MVKTPDHLELSTEVAEVIVACLMLFAASGVVGEPYL